jgi:hypothetical protein
MKGGPDVLTTVNWLTASLAVSTVPDGLISTDRAAAAEPVVGASRADHPAISTVTSADDAQEISSTSTRGTRLASFRRSTQSHGQGPEQARI